MKLSAKNKKELDKIFSFIDLKLSSSNIDISQRPFLAVSEFVENFVTEIKGDSKEGYHTKNWFKKLYNYTVEWYKTRYGNAFISKSKKYLKGVILIHHTPFEVQIPETIVKDDDDGISKWMIFPNEVLPDENILEWIVNKPNLNDKSIDIEEINSQIIEIASNLRAINISLISVKADDEIISGMLSGIMKHLESAAKDILQYDSSGVAMAYWEIQMALEKIIKVYLIQNGEKNPYNHNIGEMVQTSIEKFNMEIDLKLFEGIPSEKEAIQYRYCEISGTTPQYAYNVFKNALLIVQNYSNSLTHNVRWNNASFKFVQPPWMTDD